MKNRFSKYDPASYAEVAKWREICPEGEFRKVSPEKLQGLLPNKFIENINSFLVIASASASPPATVILANANRVDRITNAIDQEPYLAVFYHETSAASGGFVHHGNWPGRTTIMGRKLFEAINASGINISYPLQEMPSSSAGLIGDLKVDSQHQAFWRVVYKYELVKKISDV